LIPSNFQTYTNQKPDAKVLPSNGTSSHQKYWFLKRTRRCNNKNYIFPLQKPNDILVFAVQLITTHVWSEYT